MAPKPRPKAVDRRAWAEAEATAMIADTAMRETEVYLGRGRTFASTAIDEIRLRWIAAFKAWFHSRTEDNLREMNDLEAELRLRGVEPPYEKVGPELEAMRAEIERAGPRNPSVERAIQEFRASLSTPKN